MIKELEAFVQEKLLGIITAFIVIVALLQIVSGIVMDFILMMLLSGVMYVVVWIENRKKDKSSED